jgi:hypothetical protein
MTIDYVEKKIWKLRAGKVVEINENKHAKRKYHTSHSMNGQWVFKETDSDSGW